MQGALFDTVPHFTVTDLVRRLRAVLEGAVDLRELWVQGELSNFSRPASGHVYFSLKDGGAQVRCVMWRNDAMRIDFKPADGMLVEVHGSMSVYEAGGQVQLYADEMRPLGEGALYAEFMRLKAVLEAEGLFDPERKRPIPDLPRRIGIVTSPSGAALQDILNTLTRRYPLAEVILSPSPVQGAEAPTALVAALERLDLPGKVDVILLARGGGSIEDLWAFNDEKVVRAVAGMRVPVICGVGHETDFTLADFAADLRAPTPTAAAELATPVTLQDLAAGLGKAAIALQGAVMDMVAGRSENLEWLEERLRLATPARRLQEERQRLDESAHRLEMARMHRFGLAHSFLSGMDERLKALNPQAVLKRGYAIVTRESDGQAVTEVAHARSGDVLQVRVSDGTFKTRVPGE